MEKQCINWFPDTVNSTSKDTQKMQQTRSTTLPRYQKKERRWTKKDHTNAINDITKTCLYSFDPLKPHFYTVKLGFTWVNINFLFLLKNIDCGYWLEPPRRGGSNEYPQSMFWAEIWKLTEFVIWKFSFLVEKISVYLNRRVFIMKTHTHKQRRTAIEDPPWNDQEENH